MVLIFPLLGLGLLLAALAVVATVLLRRRRAANDALPVAHPERLTALPAYRAARRRFRTFGAIAVTAALLGFGALALAAARPAEVSVRSDDRVNRDIVLCLDISGSMIDVDAEIVGQFLDLVDGFRGERISLVLWDSSAVQTFPLTDDYDYVVDQLEMVHRSMDDWGGWSADSYSLWPGTTLGDGYSLIGDGLGACVLAFDRPEEERSRTIILATDNQVAGNAMLTLDEAATLAVEAKVRVYAIDPALYSFDDDVEEMRRAAERTGGDYFQMRDGNANALIVARVLAEKASATTGPKQLLTTDVPVFALVLGIVAVWLLLAAGAVIRR